MIGVDLVRGWVRKRRAVRRRFNPYIAGTPVFDRQLFFGREPVAKQTMRLLSSRSVQLTGEQRIGKTSFLHHLKCGLSEHTGDDSRAFPVFADLEAVPAAGVFRALIDETTEALSISRDTQSELRAHAERDSYTEQDFGHDARRVVAELRERAGRPVRLVLLIDEIDAPCGSPLRTVEAWLGPLLHNGPEELRLVAAGATCGAERCSIELAALDRVELAPFTPEDGEALVKRPVAGVFRYEPQAVERILELSRLRPFDIQRRCLHAVDRMLDANRSVVRLTDLEASS